MVISWGCLLEVLLTLKFAVTVANGKPEHRRCGTGDRTGSALQLIGPVAQINVPA